MLLYFICFIIQCLLHTTFQLLFRLMRVVQTKKRNEKTSLFVSLNFAKVSSNTALNYSLNLGRRNRRGCQELLLRIKQRQRIAITKLQLQASSRWLQQIRKIFYVAGGLRTVRREYGMTAYGHAEQTCTLPCLTIFKGLSRAVVFNAVGENLRHRRTLMLFELDGT